MRERWKGRARERQKGRERGDGGDRSINLPSSAYFWIPALLVALALATLRGSWRAGLALLAVATSSRNPLLARRWRAVEHSRVFDAWRRRHRLRVVVPARPYCSQRALFAHFSHAVFPFGPLLTMALSGNPNSGVPSPHTGVVADALLRAPIVGLLFRAIGCYGASKASIMRLLSRSSVGIIPEGIAGVFHGARPGRERVYLKNRKGFVKCALEAGVDLVPVYHFHSSVLDLVAPRWVASLSRRFRAAVVYPAGVAGLPLPRPDPILTAVGDAIKVKQTDAPSQALIDATHAEFVDKLRAAFDGHKHLAGPAYAKKELEVV